MLRYLGTGTSDYGERPIGAGRREGWEFQAVLRGRIQPLLPDRAGTPRARHVWTFPPGSPHGWSGLPGCRSEVVVFHFDRVPATLEEVIGDAPYLATPLQPTDCGRLRELAGMARRVLREAGPTAELQQDLILTECCLLAVRGRSRRHPKRDDERARLLVTNALSWYSEHLPEGPGLEQVAAAVYVSVAHLRRLFHRVLGASPRQELERLRMQRARELLDRHDLPIEAVATACGYGSASSFSRSFKQGPGYGPKAWRRREARHRHRP